MNGAERTCIDNDKSWLLWVEMHNFKLIQSLNGPLGIQSTRKEHNVTMSEVLN